jgi:tetratricopeptide (TPR) repeat protein/tRNA A-37 threonylcarbamoyl transferase component Bud32
MEPTRLATVEAIFHAALDIPAEQLLEFLDERCAGDASLRREVESLLAAHQRADGFIDEPVASLDVAALEDDEADRMVGQSIGHWEILKRIGSGGMGAVYLARRADRQYEHQVALKLIKRGMDTEAMLRRFRNERQILAGFDHPNIARLLDGDTTADGLPYFVMEYVEGLPIDLYCDGRALSVDERLRLFREVCAAVSYAHRRAVIHRDLKCSNILVSGDGVPKLLDFGIARFLQPGAAAEEATQVGLRALTPEFASPEQVRGEPVTTASDVYSLGVVLYRLLAGRLPGPADVQPKSGAGGEAPVPRPSAVVDAASSRQLRGDLDNIVLMALRSEPERRYSSVEQFSEDIRRHLEALPVLACRDTLAYRAVKFMRRNAAASAAAALVVLSLVGGIVLTSWQAERARQQEVIALTEKARAERRFSDVRQLASSVLFDYNDAIRDLSGATAIRERLVKDGLAYLDSLAAEARGDPALQRELAAAYDRLGDVRNGNYAPANLGDLAGAMDSYTKALRIRESLAFDAPDDVQNRRDLAASYQKIGAQLSETREAARGAELLRKGIAVLEGLAAERPDDLEIRQELAANYNLLGLGLEGLGEIEDSLASHRKALALRESLVAADPQSPKYRRSVVISEINLGRALVLSGDFEGGIASNRKALASCEALLAESPNSADYRRLLANTYQNDGDYRAILHDVEGAVRSFRMKLEFDLRSLAEDPDNVVAQRDFAYTQERLGYLLAEGGRSEAALAHYQQAANFYAKAGADAPEDLFLRFRDLMTRAGIGEMQARLGQRADAVQQVSRVAASLERFPVDPRSSHFGGMRAQVLMRLAAAHAALGASARLGAAERRQHWSTARVLNAQSLEIWQEMKRRGMLTADDAAKPEEIAAEISRCDAALRALAG